MDDPNRIPYTGQLGMAPQPPPQQPPSNSQLYGQNYNMGAPRTPTAPSTNTGINAGAVVGAAGRPPFPNQIGANNLGFGAGNVGAASPTSQYTSGGNEIIPGGNAGSPLIINPDTGRPYTTGDGKAMAFVGSGGLSQYGNPNLGLLGGDPMNYGTGLGGQYSYANVQNAKLQGMAGDVMNRQGPQANLGAANMFAQGAGNSLQNANQTNLLGVRQGLDMAGLANGQGAQGQLSSANALMGMSQMPAGPSVAEQAMRMQSGQNERSQAALAAGARGGNSALALNNAAANAASTGGQLQQQLGIQRAQEDMANRQFSANTAQAAGGMYGQHAQTQSNAYGGAANVFGNVAGNQLGQANTGANLTGTYAGLAGQQLGADVASRGQNDQTGLGLMGMGYGLQQNDRNAALAQQQANMDLNARLYGINRGVDEQQAAREGEAFQRYLGAGISAVGTMGAMSDIRAKKNIKPAGEDVSNAFRAANRDANTIASTDVPYPMAIGGAPAYSYEYKNPSAPGAKPGVQYGPMAQDLEKTPAGASVVVNGPNGMKGIDTPRLTLMNAGELAKQRAELDALMQSKNLTVDRRAPMVTQLPKLDPSHFGQYGAPDELNAYAPQHAQVLGYNMDGTPILGGPQGRIGFGAGQMGYRGVG